jgi:hypothetical protein
MAQVTGLVQRLTIIPGAGTADSVCCLWVGASPTNTTLLAVVQKATDSAQAGSFIGAMVETLVAAQVNRREVIVVHGDSDSLVISVTLNP